ncbi:hypothetical protein JOQ06_027657 [Pogonophryne albipinna]|uniref:Afadin n=1 Tax=Pogonophryne albipinna TaxID=1090488 RepID=A0AAD6F578_9TELE|nr:hypothetical protein JOQ06_027657 [Pogonophryne albipinna]
MTGSREEERRKLADIINHWNANRLDLFEISRPTELICSSTCHSEPLASPLANHTAGNPPLTSQDQTAIRAQ